MREAKNNLLNNNTIKQGQILVNYTIDKETSYYFGIIATTKIIVSADVIDYNYTNNTDLKVKSNISLEEEKKILKRKTIR